MKIESTHDDVLERLVLAHSPRFQAMLEKSRRSLMAGNVVWHGEFWKTVAKRQKTKPTPSKRK